MSDTDDNNNSSVNILVVLAGLGAVVTLVAVLLVPALSGGRRHSPWMKNSANLRGIAMSLAISGNSNNDYLPGFDASGELLAPEKLGMPKPPGLPRASGAAASARLWLLLNGQYIGADLLFNPKESLTKWVSGNALITANFSYAGLQIGDHMAATSTAGHEGRAAEWKNNANSQAIWLSDRLLDPSGTSDAKVQSLWIDTKGKWLGNVVWGDVHAEFAQSNVGFTTRYGSVTTTTTTNDNLFVTRPSPGVTEGATDPSANAAVIYY